MEPFILAIDRLSALSTIDVSTINVAKEIDFKKLRFLPAVAQGPLTLQLPSSGLAVLFRFGCVVLFSEASGDRTWLIKQINHACFKTLPGQPEAISSHARIIIDYSRAEGSDGCSIYLHHIDLDRLHIAADVLAKSNQVASVERRLSLAFDKIDPLARDLSEDGRFSVNTRHLMSMVGTMLLVQQQLIDRAEVTEGLSVLLAKPKLANLYNQLKEGYEISERSKLIGYKLNIVRQTAQTLLETVRFESSHRIEIYILTLISLELLLALYKHFSSL